MNESDLISDKQLIAGEPNVKIVDIADEEGETSLSDQSMIEVIRTEDLVQVLMESFKTDQMMKFFEVNANYTFKGQALKLDRTNSILLEFNKLKGKHTYRLLLLLNLYCDSIFTAAVHHDLIKIQDSNVDKVSIMRLKPVNPNQVEVLRSMQATILQLTEEDMHRARVIEHFYPFPTHSHSYAVYINRIANRLTKRLKKIFHLVLSEIAAETYDTEYGTDKNLGTCAYMLFEEQVIDAMIMDYLNKRPNQGGKIIVDVGCGTGRHSLRLATLFDEVYGYDFSPKMIQVAKQKKKRDERLSHCLFCEADVEFESIRYESDIMGKADIVIASFGMGSFVEDTDKMIKRYYEWLKPGGRLFISFYNSDSVLLNVTPNWRDTSLSAKINIENNTLQVQLEKDVIFQIFCRPFDSNIRTILKKYFTSLNIYTYPTTIALMPNSLLQNTKALELFSGIDVQLADNSQYKMGHYVLFCGEKTKTNSDRTAFSRVMKNLEGREIAYDLLEHATAVNGTKLRHILRLPTSEVVVNTSLYVDTQNESFVFVSTKGKKQINRIKLLSFLNNKVYQFKDKPLELGRLRTGIQSDLITLFDGGAIVPFAEPKNTKAIKIVDKELLESTAELVYITINDYTKTLIISKMEFFKLLVNFHPMAIK